MFSLLIRLSGPLGKKNSLHVKLKMGKEFTAHINQKVLSIYQYILAGNAITEIGTNDWPWSLTFARSVHGI